VFRNNDRLSVGGRAGPSNEKKGEIQQQGKMINKPQLKVSGGQTREGWPLSSQS